MKEEILQIRLDNMIFLFTFYGQFYRDEKMLHSTNFILIFKYNNSYGII